MESEMEKINSDMAHGRTMMAESRLTPHFLKNGPDFSDSEREERKKH